MIKKLVLIVAMGTVGLLWGSGDVTIQVINAVKEKSITPEFDKKLAKSGLSIHKVVECGRYIVTLGTFKDEKSAQSALKKVRSIVCKEAFVRFVKRDQVARGSHDTAKNIKSDKEVNAVAAHEVSGHAVQEVTAVVVPKTEHVAAVDVKPVVVTPVCPSVDKKEVYQNEIAEAISYYKNSRYHRFEPVMLLP